MNICVGKIAAVFLMILTVWSSCGAYAAEQCTSDQWGTLVFGDVTIYNNIWGAGAGKQTVCASGPNGMTVKANHAPTNKQVKSYPNISVEPKRELSSFQSITVDISQTLTTGGNWNATYRYMGC